MSFIKKQKLSLTTRRATMGYIFVLPFIIGLLTFFIIPLLQNFVFSINNLAIGQNGFTLSPIGFSNYYNAIFVHPTFRRLLFESIGRMAADVPLIIIFSFFAASLLNQNFKGRGMARAIFFLPVILASGVIRTVEQSDILINLVRSTAEDGTMQVQGALKAIDLGALLLQTRINPQYITYLINAVNHIYDIVAASGVQILVFLAGLQSISPSLFEASNIEGATGWENFWKITFPMVSPLILVNTVYSIIDAFTHSNNAIMVMVRDIAFMEHNYGLSAAISNIYFITILIILGLVLWIISKNIYYQE